MYVLYIYFVHVCVGAKIDTCVQTEHKTEHVIIIAIDSQNDLYISMFTQIISQESSYSYVGLARSSDVRIQRN